jgi:hypothetical protein
VTFAPGTVNPDRRALTVALSQIDGISELSKLQPENPKHFRYELLASRDLREDLFHFANQQGLVMLELSRAQSNLEEVFRRLTSK